MPLITGATSSGTEFGQTKKESSLVLVFVEPFLPGDAVVEREELHLIAYELFINALASTKKFTFAKDLQVEDVQMTMRATVTQTADGLYRMDLSVVQAGKGGQARSVSDMSIEELVTKVADEVGKLAKRTGYVIKREGGRIVIARGSQDGVEVGQHYRTTDTFEPFVITKVTLNTAEGRIIGGLASGASRLGRRELGKVDIVFVLDTTGSMQEEIDGVLENCERFANRLADKQIDARLGLVTFRVGVEEIKPLTSSVEEFKGWVRPLKAEAGGIETPFLALDLALKLQFRPGAVPILILITDEPAYDALADVGKVVREGKWHWVGGRSRSVRDEVWSVGIARRVLDRLRRLEAVVFPVTLEDTDRIYPHLAEVTGGTFYDLERSQDFTALLGRMGHKIEGMFAEVESSVAVVAEGDDSSQHLDPSDGSTFTEPGSTKANLLDELLGPGLVVLGSVHLAVGAYEYRAAKRHEKRGNDEQDPFFRQLEIDDARDEQELALVRVGIGIVAAVAGVLLWRHRSEQRPRVIAGIMPVEGGAAVAVNVELP